MSLASARNFNGEQTLDQIIQEIYDSLQKLSSKRFNRWMGKRWKRYDYHLSWYRVNVALTYFVKDPKRYYQSTMESIEQEINKFPTNSDYSKQLKKLTGFLAQGPSFSENYECQIRIPEKLTHNWKRFNKLNENA